MNVSCRSTSPRASRLPWDDDDDDDGINEDQDDDGGVNEDQDDDVGGDDDDRDDDEETSEIELMTWMIETNIPEVQREIQV